MKTYPGLEAQFADVRPVGVAGGPPRLCIATPDITGLVRNGGIGTSFYHTARVLTARGASVTVLFCNWVHELDDQILDRAVADFAREGIRLEILLRGEGPETAAQFYPQDHAVSYLAYRWLKRHQDEFDVVLFPEWLGPGYYSLMAKRTGVAFHRTALWVQTHSSSLWHALSNNQIVYDPPTLRRFQMERSSVELADLVVSPTHYLLDWKERHGFTLPTRACVQPLLIAYDDVEGCSAPVRPVDEFVFFGRLEKRKGIHHFCHAVRKLARENPEHLPEGLKVTFLGKFAEVDGEASVEFILRSLKGLPIKVSILATLGHAEAIDYLRGGNRVAFICSVADNSPLTVIECMHHRLPFLAARVGGIPELVPEAHHGEVLFSLDPGALRDAMLRVLEQGARSVPPKVRQADNVPAWVNALGAATAEARSAPPPARVAATEPPAAGAAPEVTVCITHYNRRAMLQKTMQGLAEQTFRDFEVIVVDDGSTDPDALAYLERLSHGADGLPRCQVLRQRNRFVGAARNAAIKAARGRYVVIMDDDNYAAPRQLELFVTAMRTGRFDALTCVAIHFAPEHQPGQTEGIKHLYLPLGTGVSANLTGNYFGDANGIFRKESLAAVGGFSEDYGLSWEDYELFMKLAVAGHRLGVVPEPLMWLRATEGSVSRTGSMVPNYYRALRPLFEHLDWRRFGDAVMLAAGTMLQQIHHAETEAAPGRRTLQATARFDVTGIRAAARQATAAGDRRMAAQLLLDNGSANPAAGMLLFDWAVLEWCAGRGEQAVARLESIGPRAREHAGIIRLLAAAVTTDAWDDLVAGLERLVAAGDAHPDLAFLLGRILVLRGRLIEGLRRFARALDREEAAYYSVAPDVRRGVDLGHISSGIDHYIAHGRREGRPFDYIAPPTQPLAPGTHEEVVDYAGRFAAATRGPRVDWPVLNQLLKEALSGNVALELCSLSREILRAADAAYRAAYPDVQENVSAGGHVDGLDHYQQYGRREARGCEIAHIDAAALAAMLSDAVRRLRHPGAAGPGSRPARIHDFLEEI